MKITVKQSDLAKGLSTVSHAVSSRSTLPILANILMTTDQGRLKLSATNLEIGINAWIDAEVQEEGSTTVPAKTISDLVGSLRPGQVELSVNAGLNFEDNLPNAPVEVKGPDWVMCIKGQGSNATVKGMDPEEFPVISSVPGADSHLTFDAGDLKEILSQVTIAAADDDARPVLTGTHVEVRTNELGEEVVTFAAADAFRLAVFSTTACKNPHLPESAIIPAKSLEELAKILPNEGEVHVWISKAQAIFHAGGVDLVTRLIEGTFPNFRGIMPKEHTTRAVIETKEFSAAVKTVTPFARDSSNIAHIKIGPSWLTIEANAEDIGSNVSTIDAVVDGPNVDIIFNVKYLQDVLSALDTPEVALELVSAARPGVVKPVGPADYTYIIMPMSTAR